MGKRKEVGKVQYINHYQSPKGYILLAVDEAGLTVYFSGWELDFFPLVKA